MFLMKAIRILFDLIAIQKSSIMINIPFMFYWPNDQIDTLYRNNCYTKTNEPKHETSGGISIVEKEDQTVSSYHDEIIKWNP